MIKVSDIAQALEAFAPMELQESYDNAGLQVGNPDMPVTAALLCLDVTEEMIDETIARKCNMIISHHPLLFKGLKHITGDTYIERIVIRAIRENIAIYSAHTNLDSTFEGVSYEIAHSLSLRNVEVLCPNKENPKTGLGIIGDIEPTPKLEFLRKIRDEFNVRSLRFSAQSPQIVIRKVALCGGAGADFIEEAVHRGADCYITGDLKYHDFTTWGTDILLADLGHFESELISRKIFARVLNKKFPDFVTWITESEKSPVSYI